MMAENPAVFTHYECSDCGFTSILAGDPCRDPCPICEGDTGRANIMGTRPATVDDRVEGRNALADAMLAERSAAMTADRLADRLTLPVLWMGVVGLASMGMGSLPWATMDGRSPSGPGSISLRSTEPLRVSAAYAVTIPIAGEE